MTGASLLPLRPRQSCGHRLIASRRSWPTRAPTQCKGCRRHRWPTCGAATAATNSHQSRVRRLGEEGLNIMSVSCYPEMIQPNCCMVQCRAREKQGNHEQGRPARSSCCGKATRPCLRPAPSGAIWQDGCEHWEEASQGASRHVAWPNPTWQRLTRTAHGAAPLLRIAGGRPGGCRHALLEAGTEAV